MDASPIMLRTIQGTSTPSIDRAPVIAAVAQHGDVVADADQLLQPVRDVDDADALRLQVARSPGTAPPPRRPTAPRSARPGSGCARPAPAPWRSRRSAAGRSRRSPTGVSGSMSCSSRRIRAARRLALRAPCRCRRRPRVCSRPMKMFSATVRFGNRFSSWKTMPMPCARRLARCERKRTVARRPSDRALGQLLDAGDDLHQRRLARAVLAHQHVDRAHAQVEIDVLERPRAGIDLGRRPGSTGRSGASRHWRDLQRQRSAPARIGSRGRLQRRTRPRKRRSCPTRSPSGSRSAADAPVVQRARELREFDLVAEIGEVDRRARRRAASCP